MGQSGSVVSGGRLAPFTLMSNDVPNIKEEDFEGLQVFLFGFGMGFLAMSWSVCVRW